MRALANELRTALGQPVIIEPKPGGNNMIAARNCAEAAPNGYTICALPGDSLISDLLFKRVPYDPNKDFAAVTTLLFNTQVMAVNAELKVNNLDELAALAKAKPRTLAYTAPALYPQSLLRAV